MINSVKIGILSIIIIFILYTLGLYKAHTELQEDYSKVELMYKSTLQYYQESEKSNTVLYTTIDNLKFYKDSIDRELLAKTKLLKIKNKNIESLQYLLSKSTKIDTIIFRDTIFKNNLKLDTTINSFPWYSASVKLEYPNKIVFSPEFISKKSIITSYKKETIKPRSKWWIIRLFQKKRKVLKVDIIEENPYIKDSITKYIKIIK